MAYIQDNQGLLYPEKGMCAGCGHDGKFSHTVVIPGKGPMGSNKPLAVYVCTLCDKARR